MSLYLLVPPRYTPIISPHPQASAHRDRFMISRSENPPRSRSQARRSSQAEPGLYRTSAALLYHRAKLGDGTLAYAFLAQRDRIQCHRNESSRSPMMEISRATFRTGERCVHRARRRCRRTGTIGVRQREAGIFTGSLGYLQLLAR